MYITVMALLLALLIACVRKKQSSRGKAYNVNFPTVKQLSGGSTLHGELSFSGSIVSLTPKLRPLGRILEFV